MYLLLQGTELSGNSICVGLKHFSAFGEPERRRRLPLRGKGIDLEDIDSAGEMIAWTTPTEATRNRAKTGCVCVCVGARLRIRRRLMRMLRMCTPSLGAGAGRKYPSSVAADVARAAASVVDARSCDFCCGGDGGRCASAGRNCSYHGCNAIRGSGLMLLAPRPLRLCPCSKGGSRVERSSGGSRGGME